MSSNKSSSSPTDPVAAAPGVSTSARPVPGTDPSVDAALMAVVADLMKPAAARPVVAPVAPVTVAHPIATPPPVAKDHQHADPAAPPVPRISTPPPVAPVAPPPSDVVTRAEFEELMAAVSAVLRGAQLGPAELSSPLLQRMADLGRNPADGRASAAEPSSGAAPGIAPAGAVRAVGAITSDAFAQLRGATVLPRLGMYRVSQVEKHVHAYGDAQARLWLASTTLQSLRHEIEERARTSGLSIVDIVAKTAPGGELAQLGERFAQAVVQSPEAQTCKRAMDKALDSFARQYGVAQEEQLNPDAVGPAYDAMGARLTQARDLMQERTAGVPAFAKPIGGLEAPHGERFNEAMERIIERVREMAAQIGAMFRNGRNVAENEMPSP
ncbi:hypothetical protein [Tahibacter amnicola]|uniref:Uncharacterized protein n=1 Tax=Tahibacter amnicola TaxID=2976241 RepID=A0ABY6BEY5_9GAMM|nr:hypothetical protein [Tahibacter amnicola]UXI68370.1 hypothetical protein N4264_01580 [Tahibacter amnicola]